MTYDPYTQAGTYWTAARDTEIRAIWPTMMSDAEVLARINAMPGRQIPEIRTVGARALKMSVFRPEEFAQEKKRQSALIGAAKREVRRLAGEIAPIPHERKYDDAFRAKVAELLAEGCSRSEIARQLSTRESPLTKSAMVGLVSRMGLAGPPPVRAAKPHTRSHRATAPRVDCGGRGLMGPQSLPAGMGLPAAPTEPPVFFDAIGGSGPRYVVPGQHQCCWPLGEPGKPGFGFCCADVTPGRPYCQPHSAIAYIPRPRPQLVAAVA